MGTWLLSISRIFRGLFILRSIWGIYSRPWGFFNGFEYGILIYLFTGGSVDVFYCHKWSNFIFYFFRFFEIFVFLVFWTTINPFLPLTWLISNRNRAHLAKFEAIIFYSTVPQTMIGSYPPSPVITTPQISLFWSNLIAWFKHLTFGFIIIIGHSLRP